MGKLERAVTAALLALFALYQIAGGIESRYSARGPISAAVGDVFWPINWRMFTTLSRSHSQARFEGLEGGQWVTLPMEQWFPAKWESGYRWERPWVYEYRTLQEPFLVAACERSGLPAVRMVLRSWNKRLGQREQPVEKPREKLLRTWTCGAPYSGPTGKVF